jgi:hypothetical protein
MHGISDDDAHDGKAARETGQRTEIVTAIVLPLQGEHRLRRQAQFVRDSYADAAVADVEGEIAGMRDGVQRFGSCIQLNGSSARNGDV